MTPDVRTERATLTRDAVLRSAVTLADEEGFDAVTMRRLGERLGVEAMSLYHHVSGKTALVDGMVSVVVDEMNDRVCREPLPARRGEWKAALRRRILLAREVMLAHPWAPHALSRSQGMAPGLVAYYEGILAILHAGGFPYALAHNTLHTLGSRAVGFSDELFDTSSAAANDAAEEMVAAMRQLAPHLTAMIEDGVHTLPEGRLGWCDDQSEFVFALDVLLDGLDQRLRAARRPAT